MALRILHFADLHLDASFAASGMPPSVASRRREDLRGALRRILALAVEREADVVTIGGDLYEQDRCTMDTGNFLREQFARLAPTPVLVAPGNHDPWLPHSLYRQIEWPSNVFIFNEPSPQPHVVGGVTFWGAAHCSPSVRENMLVGCKVPCTGTHVLLLHASDTAAVPPGKPVHCPLNSSDVTASGFRLALLGHYHGARLTPSGRPLLCYPGSPEPLGFDETGKRYALFVEIEGDDLRAELVALEHSAYVSLSVDVSSATTREDIREQIIKLAQEKDLDRAYVRLRLVGTLHPDVEVNLDALALDLSERFAFLDIQDRTSPAYDLEALKQDLTVKGAFVRKMLDAIERRASSGERDVAEAALYLGIQALDRKELRLT